MSTTNEERQVEAIAAQNNLTQAVATWKSGIAAERAQEKADFEAWKAGLLDEFYKDFFPNAGFAAGPSEIKQYAHFKLPLKAGQGSGFLLEATGYEYRRAAIIRARFVGYSASGQDQVIYSQASGSHSPAIYVGSDNDVYIRMTLANSQWCSISIASYRTFGPPFRPGQLVGTFSDLQEL